MSYICNMKALQENLEKVKTQMRRGVIELCILSIIAEQEAYSTDIIRKLEEAKLIVVEGTVYPLLNRLKKAGLLEYRWLESDQGPPRKYYQVTETGKVFLTELKDTWDDLVQAVNNSTKNITT